jgi:hypothetical protein
MRRTLMAFVVAGASLAARAQAPAFGRAVKPIELFAHRDFY